MFEAFRARRSLGGFVNVRNVTREVCWKFRKARVAEFPSVLCRHARVFELNRGWLLATVKFGARTLKNEYFDLIGGFSRARRTVFPRKIAKSNNSLLTLRVLYRNDSQDKIEIL